MLAGLKSRCRGKRIACNVSRSLMDDMHTWTAKEGPAPFSFSVVLERKSTKVLLYANPKCPCQRGFDQVRLLVNNVDVFIPLLCRLRLRAAARCRIQQISEIAL